MGCYHRPYVSASKAERDFPFSTGGRRFGMRRSGTRLHPHQSEGIRSGVAPLLRGEIESDDLYHLIPADGVIKVVGYRSGGFVLVDRSIAVGVIPL